ncbi:hypothetical protein [Paenarthrobacter sp. C1]|uniref:hypothetical protein n=1 Tax=Paenarthrobacter sp. C1 TaxID=3400220 RepID=UPI003BF4F241
MDFKDLFGQKLQAQSAAEAAANAAAAEAADAHAAIVRELEPKLRALVLEVFDALRSSGVPPVPSGGAGSSSQAYALGTIHFNRWGDDPYCDIAIDSAGKIALRHPVKADKERPHTVRSCSPLAEGYSQLLGLACRDDEPRNATRVHLSQTTGELMFTNQYIAGDDYHYRRTSLAEHLAELAAKTVAGS